MGLPSPRFRRMATLVVIDADEQVALFQQPGEASGHWALPQGNVRLSESYAEAAARVTARCFNGRPVRWGSVIGRRWAPPPDDQSLVRVEEHLFLARAGPSVSSSSASADCPGPTAVWTPRAALDQVLRESHVDSTTDLVHGYLDGWLPDGPITLY
ncbi:NUDIX domain-containing protein [Streptomyces sp. NBC_00467]|uniref:NUDIX domain-containing protein n=1 Tax=Streptomyces sp. NBC_00467 TaxID=2975752 RepID=UPI003FA6E41C